MNRLSPTNDLAFKKVFASEENKDILCGLINDFFAVKVEEITITNPYSIDVFKNLKSENINELRYVLRDVSASFKTADFTSELQMKKAMHFDERSHYYPMKKYCENYNLVGRMKFDKDGTPIKYSSLRPVYALNILGYNHFDDDEALRIFELYDPVRNKKPNKELLKIGYFELGKTQIETANQKYWRDFFVSGEIGENTPSYIKKASEIIDFANLGEEERKVAESLEKARATIQDELAYSYFEGMEKGKTEGLLEGILKTARSFLQKGFKPEDIADCTGLSLEQIQQLQSQ